MDKEKYVKILETMIADLHPVIDLYDCIAISTSNSDRIARINKKIKKLIRIFECMDDFNFFEVRINNNFDLNRVRFEGNFIYEIEMERKKIIRELYKNNYSVNEIFMELNKGWNFGLTEGFIEKEMRLMDKLTKDKQKRSLILTEEQIQKIKEAGII